MKLQLISDLHTEFHDNVKRLLEHIPIAPDLDFLVVAGDTFVVNRQHEQDILPSLRFFSRSARHVIWIEGNHEYYGTKISSDTDTQIAKYLSVFPNIHWLRNEEITLDGVHFYGGPMWFPNADGLDQLHEREISDFSQIKDLRLWVYLSNKLFRHFAREQIDTNTIVVSHHLPHYNSVPHIYRSCDSRFFVSDESKLIAEKQPRYFLHGHTHTACDYWLGKTHVICNPYGYPSERGSTPYLPVVVEV
jgi:Icc-related predicted phosphoesterase